MFKFNKEVKEIEGKPKYKKKINHKLEFDLFNRSYTFQFECVIHLKEE